jgi:hypothetical protein
LITAFPAFESAAKDTPDLGATHRIWIAAWDDLTLSECQAALGKLVKAGGIGWDDYRSPGPFIRSLVMRDRKNAPKSEEELVRFAIEQRVAAKRRAEYQKLPIDATMQRAFAVGRAMLDRGEPMHFVHDVTDRIIAGEDVGDIESFDSYGATA